MFALAFASVLAVASSSVGQTLDQEQIQAQNEIYSSWWGTELNWKFDELPTKGTVPSFRVPYSGFIYPDRGGGTRGPLAKYDRAFNGNYAASSYENRDNHNYQPERKPARGLFGRVRMTRTRGIPHWHGHCNGWAAAAMRHAEPEHNVVRNGVTFTPSDIKGLLAEIYIYLDAEMVAGTNTLVKPAMLHVALANWLGRCKYPIAMEATPGKEKWNYPIYSFASASAKRGSRQVEVKTNILYAWPSDYETDKSPKLQKKMYFHYMLTLSQQGDIVGGYFFGDSSRIDMLWLPVAPLPGGKPGNELGNPYVNVDRVIDIWRDSVSGENTEQWVNVDSPQDLRFQLLTEKQALASTSDPSTREDDAQPEDESTGTTTDVAGPTDDSSAGNSD